MGPLSKGREAKAECERRGGGIRAYAVPPGSLLSGRWNDLAREKAVGDGIE